MTFRPAGLLLATLAATPVFAQQFQQTPLPPGPIVWTEAVEVFDANGDGRLDVLFGNGLGFSSAGGALAPTLLINTSPGVGTISFADETAARLPVGFTQQNKGLVVFDVDNDGDRDVVFANAFANQPTLLVNNGTGVFTNETATRLPAMTLNSFGGGFGDVDNDGDLDLVLADAGASAFGGVGGMARLFLNNGSGVFALAPATQLNAANKIGSQNAQLLDVDNDFDLDVIVDGKSAGQQLYLNDGAGTFTLQATTLPAGSANTYATDFSDLDNDNDLDGVYISLSGFNEGTAQNTLTRSSTLGFTGSQTTITTPPTGQDDNDVVFLDANDDGLQDFVVGSLANNQEKLYLNAGTFAAGSFVFQGGGFTSLTDSTLDLAVGDFDQDGRYDVVTGQGESGSFQNRVYRNTGAQDTRAPRIGRVEGAAALVPLSRIQGGGFARRAWVQDATYKRGQQFASARLDITAVKGPVTQSFSTPMRYVGGGLHRAPVEPTPDPGGRVGMDVTYRVHAVDPSANASDSAPVAFRICGAEGYGAALPNSTGFPGALVGVNDPSLGINAFSVQVTGLPAGRAGQLIFGTAKNAAGTPFGAGIRYVGGTVHRAGSVFANGSGVATVALDLTQHPFAGVAQAGLPLYFQFQYQDPNASTINLSNALEVVFCN
ncbi:MAG: VCBS repeat-containing protein [Vicinamibacteria bacterium]